MVGVDGGTVGGITVSWQGRQAESLEESQRCQGVCRLWSDFHARHAAKPLLVCGVQPFRLFRPLAGLHWLGREPARMLLNPWGC